MITLPKRGLILSGLTGVGKSTLQSRLLNEGCWAPHLLTSRGIDQTDDDLIEQISYNNFVQKVRSNEIVAPLIFAGNAYGWTRSDFNRLLKQPAGAIISARPYTAMLIAAAIPGLIPVWLDLPERKRGERIAKRGAVRDHDPELATRRLASDADDIRYRDFFPAITISDVNTFAKLARLIEAESVPLPTVF